MAREVIWTEPAWDDLESAADHIARDSVAYAAAFVPEVKEAAASLLEFVGRGQIVPESGDETIREFIVTPYRVVYRITPKRVSTLAIVHGATRMWRL